MKERNLQRKEAPLSKIKLFFSVWKQVLTMSPEEFRRIQMVEHEANGFRKKMRTAFKARIKHAKSYDEKLSIVAETRSAFLNEWAERARNLPKEDQERMASIFQKLAEDAQSKFKKSGKEKDRTYSQMYLRSAEVIKRIIQEQNPN